MTLFISGMLTMGYLVAGLYFLRFWRESRDRLFAIFATAFAILAAQRVVLSLLLHETGTPLLYALRALAFLLIISAIVDKNRGS